MEKLLRGRPPTVMGRAEELQVERVAWDHDERSLLATVYTGVIETRRRLSKLRLSLGDSHPGSDVVDVMLSELDGCAGVLVRWYEGDREENADHRKVVPLVSEALGTRH